MSVQLWFQYESSKKHIRKSGRRLIELDEVKKEFSLSHVKSLVFEARKNPESPYAVLDSDYLRSNNLSSLVETFDIAWGNPIIVTIASETTTETAVLAGSSTATVTTETAAVMTEIAAVTTETAVLAGSSTATVTTETAAVTTETAVLDGSSMATVTTETAVLAGPSTMATATLTTETAVLAGSSTMAIQSQTQSDEIWIRYNDQHFSYKKKQLEDMYISEVDDLIRIIYMKYRKVISNISEKTIIFRNKKKDLGLTTPISELWNTKDEPLELIIDEYNLANYDHSSPDLSNQMSKLVIDENEPEFQYASAAFGCEFKDNLNYVEYFRDYITTCHNSSKDTYVPYISIVQSSGYGKSRLIKEYANQVYTLYLNLGINRNCFPRPSSCAKEFIISYQKAKDPNVWFNTFLAMAVSLVVRAKNNNTDKNSFWKSHLDDNGQSIWEPAIKAANETNTNNDLILIRDNPGYLEQNFTNDNNDIKVLFCIDEGRTLIQETSNELNISLFRCWRRALRDNMWRAKGLFSVILDTTSRITNFSPVSGYDPTLKTLNQADNLLFKPFISIATYNSLVNNLGKFYSQAFSMGRPFWKALQDEYIKKPVDVNAEDYAWEKVKSLVKAKLQGGTNYPTDNEGKNLTSIAVLASFCSVDISPSVHFASNLIASHLGTCLSISQDRTKVLVCYPSEPLVTEAAYELLDDDMLFLIAQSFSQGVVEPGKRGEIVGELVLILTRQRFCKRLIRTKQATFYTGEIELMPFLNDLLKSNNQVLKKDSYEHQFFKNGTISFTRFVTIRTIPTLDDIKKGYKSCVAFNLKRNQQGANFLIPVKCDERYTFWIIQIKNYNLPKCSSTENSTSKLEPKYVFSKTDLANIEDPYLAMYWQLGAHQTETKEVDWEISSTCEKSIQGKTMYYVILGLKSFKIATGNTLKGLRNILEAYVDPYDKFWSSDKFMDMEKHINYIESFLPWHPPDNKISGEVLLDDYNDDDAQIPVQD